MPAVAAVRRAQAKARRALYAAVAGLVCCCAPLAAFAVLQGMGARKTLAAHGVEEGQTDARIAVLVGALEILLTILFFATRYG